MSNKDSFWFKHDSGAGRGLKIRKIQHIYGHEGKGFYWDVVEILRDQEGYKYSYQTTDLQMLASLIGAKDDVKFVNFMKDCVRFELFYLDGNYFYNKVLTENMEGWDIKKANGMKAKPKRNHKRNRSKTEAKKHIREEKRREEKSRVEIIMPFDSSFVPAWEKWLDYRKKSGKAYKTQIGQQSALNNLAKYPKEVAIEAIERSIQNEWQGLFPDKVELKLQNNGTNKKLVI